MAEQEWADEPEVPPKKRGVPGWLWFCGGGCLVALVLAIVGGYFLYGFVKDAMDPEIQWPKLEQYVQVKERPEGWMIMGFSAQGVDAFTLTQVSSGETMTFFVYPESTEDDIDELFSEDFNGAGVPMISEIENPELMKVTVQGREVSMVRFTQTNIVDEMDGVQGAFIDITPENDLRPRVLQLITKSKTVPVSAEVLAEYLAPYGIWSEQ